MNERISATHLGNERVSATHLKRGVRWEARGQMAVSSQNEGKESIAGGVYKPYKLKVSPGARMGEM